ncbi:MAG: hypothetical protein DHS20C15_15220 [Planctomycetota bacterium]|nr:MAG: hypothetical protein DHS20C15_15220 [Planctomycetota bacterium]
MIAPLRRRHRLMICVATLTLPAALWMSVNARVQVPLMAAEALPGPRVAARSRLQHWGPAGVLGAGGLETVIDAGTSLVVGLSEQHAHPRSLLYWVPTNAPELSMAPNGAASTDSARFLTTLESAALRVLLPSEARLDHGALVLWDVARGEIRDRIELKELR